MNCKLIQGECLEKMSEIESASVDMILTDPPYGTTACKWDSVIPFEPMWEQLKRIIKPNGAIVMTASQPFTAALIMSNTKMFKHCWVWDKVRGTNFQTVRFQPMKEHEDVCVFANGAVNYYPIKEKRKGNGVNMVGKSIKSNTKGSAKESVSNLPTGKKKILSELRNPSSIQTFTGVKLGALHPTQKPVDLMEYLIKTYTNGGETVLDFTMGSGTTGVACVNTNRNFIGIELDENYFNIAYKRIERAKYDNPLNSLF